MATKIPKEVLVVEDQLLVRMMFRLAPNRARSVVVDRMCFVDIPRRYAGENDS
jgi:hypothetical protein